MRSFLHLLCALSILCGLAQSFCPEGSGKRALAFACSVVLLAGVVKGFVGINWESYALETGQIRLRQEEFLQHSEEIGRSLDRRVIEGEYGAYIMDMAAEKGIKLQEAKVSAQWSLEGLWLPWYVQLRGDCGREARDLLAVWIEADLGSPRQRQEWRSDGE